MDGVIQTRNVETGQYVNAGNCQRRRSPPGSDAARFNIEPQEAPRLKPGMDADFTMRESQQAFTAKITLVIRRRP